MTMWCKNAILRFGRFWFNYATKKFGVKGKGGVRLAQNPWKLLSLLLQREKGVSKEEITAKVWGGVKRTASCTSQLIYILRQALEKVQKGGKNYIVRTEESGMSVYRLTLNSF